ncbi:glycosyltransferase [Pedobacter sp. MR2016-24]|uniref:glycosyltransferase n=1 Tax=Pedobacter sp. MR2016-24 TaxID=2994466 RepID=UPI002246F6E4|nr:glycosyltransferase [Pedobacter sp. MR2016-24]MCX2484221.1 glycosyltransferase [Pedobacter sp. MR2016-24]
MVLKDKVIVFLGNTRFDSEIQATSLFIARNLAKENKVYFIDYPFTLKDYFDSSNTSERRKEKFSVFSDGLLNTDIPNLKIIITPPVLPINFLPEGFLFRSILKVNESILGHRIKHILVKEGVGEFIYINSFNFHYPGLADIIKPTLNVYHCVDPMIVPWDMKHGIKSEEQLVKQSDLVICTSKALFIEKKSLNKNSYFVPNATDSVNSAGVNQDDLHALVENLKKPIIGYLGTIERRIDYELLQEVIDLNKDKTFVFAGPTVSEHIPETFFDNPNAHMLGPIVYNEVPQMINSFDVAIIPFKKDEVSSTIFPIKLFEYLGAGKPVVATDFNDDLKDFTDNCVQYCENAKSFTEAIQTELTTNSPERIQCRKDLAKLNTWENRADQIAVILENHLSKI